MTKYRVVRQGNYHSAERKGWLLWWPVPGTRTTMSARYVEDMIRHRLDRGEDAKHRVVHEFEA